jgi:hypothetical protein
MVIFQLERVAFEAVGDGATGGQRPEPGQLPRALQEMVNELISAFEQFPPEAPRSQGASIPLVESLQQNFGVLNIAHEGLVVMHLREQGFAGNVPAAGEAFEHVTKFLKSNAGAVNGFGVARIDAGSEQTDAGEGAVDGTPQHGGGELGLGVFDLFSDFGAAVGHQLGEPAGLYAFNGAAGFFGEASLALFQMGVEFVRGGKLLTQFDDERQLDLGIAQFIKGIEMFFKRAPRFSDAVRGDKGFEQFDNGKQAPGFDAGSVDSVFGEFFLAAP